MVLVSQAGSGERVVYGEYLPSTILPSGRMGTIKGKTFTVENDCFALVWVKSPDLPMLAAVITRGGVSSGMGSGVTKQFTYSPLPSQPSKATQASKVFSLNWIVGGGLVRCLSCF